MTQAAQVIEKEVLIATMINLYDADLDIYPFRDTMLLANTLDQYKIFWGHVPDDVELPYITLTRIMGGRGQGTDTTQKHTDSIWKIVVHSSDRSRVEEFANLINRLQNTCPDVSAFEGAEASTTLQETMPVDERYQVQNQPFFIIGGLYRIMLFLGEN